MAALSIGVRLAQRQHEVEHAAIALHPILHLVGFQIALIDAVAGFGDFGIIVVPIVIVGTGSARYSAFRA